MHFMRRLVLYAGFLLLTPAIAMARPDHNFQRGLDLVQELEYDRAREALGESLANPDNTAQDRALIHLHLGIIQSSQMDQLAAAQSFERALTEDGAIRPPATISPKIMILFEEVRERHQATLSAEPATRPAPAQAPLPPPQDDLEDLDQDTSSTNWPAWITLGAGLAAGGVGIALGVSSGSARDKAEDKAVPYDQAQDHLDTANSQALTANILFITAGAAAVASGVLFYLGWDPEEEVSVAFTKTPSGVMLQLMVIR